MEVKRYKIKSTLIITIETDLEDEEVPCGETIEFLIADDLQDLGYDVNFTKATKFEIEEIN